MERPAERPLRVWLEPGYDAGRFGAWLLDIPGAFGWATSRERALQGSLSVAGRVREWLADHGETGVLPPMRGIEVVEEVPVTRHPDGTERNATFAADHRPVPADELEAVLRRLAFARSDLVELIDRLDAFEAAHGALPTTGAREERTSDDVLRHLAGSEAWLTSRLDGTIRFDGPERAGEPRRYLEAVRAWMVERIRELRDRDPAAERIDGKGESWTLAKVLRRLVYHALDHLWELDRRLARADGTGERVVVTLDRRPDVDQLVRLVHAVGWDPRADPKRLADAQANTADVVAAWDGDRLVGYARSQNDHAMTSWVSMVIVHPRWQGLGIGRRMMETLLDGHDHVRFALSTAPGVADWYASLGFEPDPRAMVRRRRDGGRRR